MASRPEPIGTQLALDGSVPDVVTSGVEEGGSNKESAKQTALSGNLRSKRARSAAGRLRTCRRLAGKLREQLVQYELDAARETCYIIVMQLDAYQRGSRG